MVKSRSAMTLMCVKVSKMHVQKRACARKGFKNRLSSSSLGKKFINVLQNVHFATTRNSSYSLTEIMVDRTKGVVKDYERVLRINLSVARSAELPPQRYALSSFALIHCKLLLGNLSCFPFRSVFIRWKPFNYKLDCCNIFVVQNYNPKCYTNSV